MREREQFLFKQGKRERKGRRSSYNLGQGRSGEQSAYNLGRSGEQSSLPTDSETYSWSWRSANPTKQFYGERRLLLNLVNESNNGSTMIGIVGLAGVGKTTLCQETFNNQDVKKHFLPRIWVCMAKQPNETDHEKEVVKRILMGLGFEDKIIEKIYKEGGGLCRLLFALRQELKGKKYLIVLDDVSSLNKGFEEFCSLLNTQDVRKSDRLANGLPTGDGGTVIVSSRCKEMAKKMVGEKNLHCLLPLADKGRSWNIFKDEVAKDGRTLPQDMEKMKDMIADRCGGLPFFAKMLGQCVHQNLQIKQKEEHETQKKESPETLQKEKKETPEKQSPKTQQKEKQETLQKESQETQKKEKHETQQEQKHETQQKGSQETQQKERQETPQENKHEIQQKASQETQQEQKQETSQENKHEIQQKESQEIQQKESQETQQKASQETQQEQKHETQQKESQETQQKEKQETPQENKHEIQQKESQETQQKESPGTQHKESKETQQKEKHETQQKESRETLKEEEIEKHET